MLVCDIMTKHVVCVRMDDTLETVREILSTRRIHHVVVLDEQRVVGIVSDRDVLRNVSPFMGTNAERSLDTATLRKRVHQFMTRHPLTIGPATQVVDAAKVLLEQGISCLPVIDEEGHVAGIVSTRDLLRAAIRVGCYIDGRRDADSDGRCAA